MQCVFYIHLQENAIHSCSFMSDKLNTQRSAEVLYEIFHSKYLLQNVSLRRLALKTLGKDLYIPRDYIFSYIM